MRIFKKLSKGQFPVHGDDTSNQVGRKPLLDMQRAASPSTNVWGGMGAVKFISSSASYSAYLEGKGSREQR